MGGSAFSAMLSAAAFPRLPPAVYKSVKARYLPKLESLYSLSLVPLEAPEKLDYGDLDILVTMPKSPHTLSVPHDITKSALDAEHVIPMDGNRTSHYAVPIKPGEWTDYGHVMDEVERRKATDDGKIYYQVSILQSDLPKRTIDVCRLMFMSASIKTNVIESRFSTHMGISA